MENPSTQPQAEQTPAPHLEAEAAKLQTQKEEQLKGFGEAAIKNPGELSYDTSSGVIMTPKDMAEHAAKGAHDEVRV